MEKSNELLGSKPHFALLDGLRGVAALLVVWYHLFEGFAFAEAVNGAGEGALRSSITAIWLWISFSCSLAS